MRNVSEKFCREKSKHILLFNNIFEKSAVYELMWKNIVEPNRPHMTI
jgi:hypothetical protein